MRVMLWCGLELSLSFRAALKVLKQAVASLWAAPEDLVEANVVPEPTSASVLCLSF